MPDMTDQELAALKRCHLLLMLKQLCENELVEALKSVEELSFFQSDAPDLPILQTGTALDSEKLKGLIATIFQRQNSGESPFDDVTPITAQNLEIKPAFDPEDKKLLRRFEELGIICNSLAMLKVLRRVEKFANGDAAVLITGPTGCGKQLVAEAVHKLSPRKEGPFVDLNCAAISESLRASELFGIEKGTATGVDARKGKLELADTGTLFLDEIGDMSSEIQASLLKVIESGNVLPVGAKTERKVDVRFLSATNKNLENEIGKRNFRQDLLQRLRTLTLSIPPLDERRGDIHVLAMHFYRERSRDINLPFKLKPSDFSLLQHRSWKKGNVRELSGYVVNICVVVRANESGLSNRTQFRQIVADPEKYLDEGIPSKKDELLRRPSDWETLQIYVDTRFNMSETAIKLGIDRSTVIPRLSSVFLRLGNKFEYDVEAMFEYLKGLGYVNPWDSQKFKSAVGKQYDRVLNHLKNPRSKAPFYEDDAPFVERLRDLYSNSPS